MISIIMIICSAKINFKPFKYSFFMAKYALFIAFLVLFSSCTTVKIGWGKGDGMNRQCTYLTSHRVPFNFN